MQRNPEENIACGRERYEELPNSLRKGTPAQVEESLDNREIVEPELTPEIIERLQQRIAEARKVAKKERQHAEGYIQSGEPGEFDLWERKQNWKHV